MSMIGVLMIMFGIIFGGEGTQLKFWSILLGLAVVIGSAM
jgi:hypothetical protein